MQSHGSVLGLAVLTVAQASGPSDLAGVDPVRIRV